MNIFLDVGGYRGETLLEVIKPRYDFDVIHTFEPVSSNCKIIHDTIKDSRVIVHEYGLWNKTCEYTIYDAGSPGGTLFKEKFTGGRKRRSNTDTICSFVKASEWFENNINNTDRVIMKINCEGAEVDIINDLLSSNKYDMVYNLMIDFDVRKIRGKETLEKETISKLNRLNKTNFFTHKQAMKGKTHQKRIAYWLGMVK